MSKAENIFAIIRERRTRDLATALFKACAYITSSCTSCPLETLQQCAKHQLPPAAFKDGVIDRSYCQDWVALHFMSKV